MAYNAFISYSHTADSTVAASLQSGLHSFAKPWYKLRALHIFRDQTNLAVNPALWSSIRDALDQASFFILLASPDAASSPWVAKEAEYWISKNGTSHVLIVLTDGALNWDRTSAALRQSPPPRSRRAFSVRFRKSLYSSIFDGRAAGHILSACVSRTFTRQFCNSLPRCTIGPR